MFNFKKTSYNWAKKKEEGERPVKSGQVVLPQTTQPAITIQMVNSSSVFVTGPFHAFDPDLKKIIKLHGGYYNDGGEDALVQQKKGWVVGQDKMHDLIDNIQMNCPHLFLRKVPGFVYKTLLPLGDSLVYQDADRIPIKIDYGQVERGPLEELIGTRIYNKLYDFQKEGVRFGVAQRGRVLIGDEMGVGKTIQALCLASVYRKYWPLVVVCPSSLRLNWKDEALRWVPGLEEFQIQVISKNKQMVSRNSQLIIISYDLCQKYESTLSQVNVIVCDEAHYLKNPQSKRSECLIPLCAKTKHIILLTGTPAFAKPKELYSLLSIVRPDIFTRFSEYGKRYCDPQPNRFTRRIEYEGSDNTFELNYILKQHIMIRRLKKDVLQELPSKVRQKIHVEASKEVIKKIDDLLKGVPDLEQAVERLMGETQDIVQEGVKDQRSSITEAYQLSGIAKIKGITQYLQELLDNADLKVIIFGQHRAVLDGIEDSINKAKVGYMRIDGSRSLEDRHRSVSRFQTERDCRVAILSIMAANMGITLTASSTVLFAEMHWTPALMQQAEDRAHRIGQQSSSVHICYLVNDQTLDRCLYRMMLKKIGVVSEILEGKKSREMDQVKQVYKDNSKALRKELQGGMDMEWIKEKQQSPVPPSSKKGTLNQYFPTTDKKDSKESHLVSSSKRRESTQNLERLMQITRQLNYEMGSRSGKSV